MRKSRFSEEQIIWVLKDHQVGFSTKELWRKHGRISDATFYNWRSKYGGMEGVGGPAAEGAGGGEPEAEEAACGVHAGQLDAEGAARKKLLTPGSRRQAVSWAIIEKGLSQRRALCAGGNEPQELPLRAQTG